MDLRTFKLSLLNNFEIWEGKVNEAQQMVQAFHEQFDIHVATQPAIPDEATQKLRIRLIHEEFNELQEAFTTQDLSAVAKELADLLYVVYGTAVSCGVDMEPVFREVHRSNMSKIGGHKRDDGKWVKPPTYSPAQIQTILNVQLNTRLNE
ncbi:MAG: MazG nucleotide pyrophosphohydrolase domain-containing protein [Nitrospirales bacterium]|nr:MazG nucleotide pyrophosphohydrolase domain-containing protein [Nitrospirales bacterium]